MLGRHVFIWMFGQESNTKIRGGDASDSIFGSTLCIGIGMYGLEVRQWCRFVLCIYVYRLKPPTRLGCTVWKLGTMAVAHSCWLMRFDEWIRMFRLYRFFFPGGSMGLTYTNLGNDMGNSIFFKWVGSTTNQIGMFRWKLGSMVGISVFFSLPRYAPCFFFVFFFGGWVVTHWSYPFTNFLGHPSGMLVVV